MMSRCVIQAGKLGSGWLTCRLPGTILPVLHLDPYRAGHVPFNIQPPQTEQTLVLWRFWSATTVSRWHQVDPRRTREYRPSNKLRIQTKR